MKSGKERLSVIAKDIIDEKYQWTENMVNIKTTIKIVSGVNTNLTCRSSKAHLLNAIRLTFSSPVFIS